MNCQIQNVTGTSHAATGYTNVMLLPCYAVSQYLKLFHYIPFSFNVFREQMFASDFPKLTLHRPGC